MNKTGLTPRLIDTNIFHLNSRYLQIRREKRNMVHSFCSLLTGALFKVDSTALKITIFTTIKFGYNFAFKKGLKINRS